jgi:metallo-beta-lactamase family protein
VDWVSNIGSLPEEVFLVHGEPTAQDALRVKLQDTYKWRVTIPKLNQIVEVNI